jgi:hypothetical protein
MWVLTICYENGKSRVERFRFEDEAYKCLVEIKKTHKVKDFNIDFILQGEYIFGGIPMGR